MKYYDLSMIILKLFYLLHTSFMLNDQSTDSVVLKAKIQQQMYTSSSCRIIKLSSSIALCMLEMYH